MKYLLLFIAVLYLILLLPCVAGLIVICSAADWEMGEGFIFWLSVLGLIIFLPLSIWSGLLYRKWPVKYGVLQAVVLGCIPLMLILAVVYFFKG